MMDNADMIGLFTDKPPTQREIMTSTASERASSATDTAHPWLQRAQREGTPLIDGETVTFIWHGEHPPHLLGDFNCWSEPALMTEVTKHVWMHTLTLPRDAYIEYAFFTDITADARTPDPLNRRRVSNGVGAYNNYFTMPEARDTPLLRRHAGIPRGVVTRHIVEGDHLVVGGKRTIYLYQPPVTEPSPLLVVFDGQDYLRRARLTTIVDNLIAQRRIRPIALAMVEHGRQARFVEYACSDSTVTFLARYILPLARQHLHLLDIDANPGVYGVLGASMGGLISLYTALRLPETFGHVLSQSGAFGLDVSGQDLVIFDLIRHQEQAPSTRVWMDVGCYEFLHLFNETMRDLLTEKGYDLAYRAYNGGHNYTSWRNDVWRGLEWLFPPAESRHHP